MSDKDLPKVGGFRLLPCAPYVCQECAVLHTPEEPHNVQSLYYQYKFWAEHGRWPTWQDALAHVAEPLRGKWIAELRKHGAWKAEWDTTTAK